MKPFAAPGPLSCLLALLLWVSPAPAWAQLRVLADKEPQQVFSGEGRSLSVTLQNAGAAPVEAEFHTRLFLATKTPPVLLADTPWKRLQVLPGQTVSDSVRLRFPLVKAETRCLVQWTEGANRLPGMIEVLVYPPDLLKDLHALASGEELGLCAPASQLPPLLKAANLAFRDLQESELESFSGKLAILGPFPAQTAGKLTGKIKALAEKGTAVVWIQPPSSQPADLQPSFYTVPQGKGAVVVVQAALLTNLAESPQAQLNLLHFARLALHPAPPRLP